MGFKPTNKDVAGVLGNPKKEEMNTKTCNFDEFLAFVKSIAETQQEGTFEDFVEGLRVFDKDSAYIIFVMLKLKQKMPEAKNPKIS